MDWYNDLGNMLLTFGIAVSLGLVLVGVLYSTKTMQGKTLEIYLWGGAAVLTAMVITVGFIVNKNLDPRANFPIWLPWVVATIGVVLMLGATIAALVSRHYRSFSLDPTLLGPPPPYAR